MMRTSKGVPPIVSRSIELTRRKRRVRRARNLLFLIVFLGMFALGFNRVIHSQSNIRLFWLLVGVAGIPIS